MRVSPAYPLDTDKIKKDGVSLTTFAHHPYVNSLAEFVKESMAYFQKRRLHGGEVVLDENSNEGASSSAATSSAATSTPRDPRLSATPGGGASFDSSLTLPEAYSTPQGPLASAGAVSGVGFCLI